MKTLKTLKTNIVGNFLRFPTHLWTPQADNWSNGYDYLKTVAGHKVQQEAWNGWNLGMKVNLSSIEW
jgi:hypothetical protein